MLCSIILYLVVQIAHFAAPRPPPESVCASCGIGTRRLVHNDVPYYGNVLQEVVLDRSQEFAVLSLRRWQWRIATGTDLQNMHQSFIHCAFNKVVGYFAGIISE